MKVSCANEYKIHSVSVVYGGIRHNLEGLVTVVCFFMGDNVRFKQ